MVLGVDVRAARLTGPAEFLPLQVLVADTGKRPPSHPVFLALGQTLKELELPKEPFDDLLSAFLQDTEKSR